MKYDPYKKVHGCVSYVIKLHVADTLMLWVGHPDCAFVSHSGQPFAQGHNLVIAGVNFVAVDSHESDADLFHCWLTTWRADTTLSQTQLLLKVLDLQQ